MTQVSRPVAREEMLPLFAEATPGFQPIWEAFIETWKDEPEPPLYVALGDLARHLTGQLAQGEVAQFPAIFALVEHCVVSGDAYVREAAVIGLLEDLQNTRFHTTSDPSDFKSWLLPRSRAWWEALDRFWTGKSPIVAIEEPDRKSPS